MISRSALALALTACAVEPGGEPDGLDGLDGVGLDGKADTAGDAWTTVGLGVAYQQVNAGHAIAIAYGGYTARLGDSAAWLTELVDARLGAAGVGHLYAVQGPADAGYNGREIGNSKLRAHLATFDDGTSPIYVVAHSSGSFVAHELFQQLHARGSTAILARIGYADLDGGGSGLTEEIADEIRDLAFVYARDPDLDAGLSHNAGAAMSLGAAYAPHATTVEVVAPGTGCADGASWCLHDALITHRPHNHFTFDLARDYRDFVDRPVVTDYLDALAP